MTRLACQTITFGHDQLMGSYPKVLQHVRDAGYEGVETTFAALRQYQDDLPSLRERTGLAIVACHVGYPMIQTSLEDKATESTLLRILQASGAEFLLVSDAAHEDVEAYRVLGQTLARFGQRLRDVNVRLLFHNHRREVEDDMVRLKTLIDCAPDHEVDLAIDFGWVLQAKADPQLVIRTFSDRMGYVHLKDARIDGTWTELGTGALPIGTVVAAIRPLHLPWWTTEQDTTQLPPELSIATNFRFLDPHRRD
ncbi:MAG: sugar phosphate isomerase/epimerase [Firmicutes bacterium]|nr:sugar phosphate isomerase/epimerase [Bacillota bacterium]MCL5065742.1 sugar phosphate isomerase/epimerase [Bacillota bacterium]